MECQRFGVSSLGSGWIAPMARLDTKLRRLLRGLDVGLLVLQDWLTDCPERQGDLTVYQDGLDVWLR